MLDDQDAEIAHFAANLERGSIIAAAGCGKTEQIARAVAFCERRRLILTHTHAGVDAITKRLKSHKISSDKYRVDTIAGWCLRFAMAFPKRSGISVAIPSSNAEWNAVYDAAARLLESGAVNSVIDASYGGLFVDEYQDCNREQHNVIRLLAGKIPSCVFGDPLQAIFDFGGQQPIDWETDVFATFPKVAELATPWRWKRNGNHALAEWLQHARRMLDEERGIDLTIRPDCLTWTKEPADPKYRQPLVVKECMAALGRANGGSLIVIGDGANMSGRAALAKNLARRGFSNIEPVTCKPLYAAAKEIENSVGIDLFKVVLAFASLCMTGTEKTALEKAVQARLAGGGGNGPARFRGLFPYIDAVIQTGSNGAILSFLRTMQAQPNAYLYRREMYFAMESALQIKDTRECETLSEAIGEVQTRIRHVGRTFAKSSIGSTLLVKGLEFDHAVIAHSANMSQRDWYVALTRATKTIHVVSPAEMIVPAA